MPAREKLAVVETALGGAKLTVPGPLTLVQLTVSVPEGLPSSLTLPESGATCPREIDWLAPAETAGGWLTTGAALTVTVTSLVEVSSESLAASRST